MSFLTSRRPQQREKKECENEFIFPVVHGIYLSSSFTVALIIKSAIPDNSSNVYLAADAKESKGQYWRLMRYKDLYVIYNPFVNKSFDIGTSRAIEEPIGVWDVSRANGNQQWVLTPKGKDRYEIKHNNAQLLLSFKPADKAGSKVYTLPASETDGVWRLKPTSEKLPPENVHGKAEWENEQIFAVNKEEGHNTFVPFSSVESLKKSESFNQPWATPASDLY